MMTYSLWTLVFLGLSATVAGSADKLPDSSQPVLVELFTSEGCSSCPPADALLEKLDRMQPVSGAQIAVLSEHVDYWNRIGWADPYSSPVFSARQQQYARRFNIQGPYTPQMVVDGRSEFVGSAERSAESAIQSSLSQPRQPVRIEASEGYAVIDVGALPKGTTRKADVIAAYALDAGTQNVSRGENKGRRLHHVAIVSELKQIGSVDTHASFQMRLPLKSGSRLIVFLQEPSVGPVWGSAMISAR